MAPGTTRCANNSSLLRLYDLVEKREIDWEEVMIKWGGCIQPVRDIGLCRN